MSKKTDRLEKIQQRQVDDGLSISYQVRFPARWSWFAYPRERAHLKKALAELGQIEECKWARDWLSMMEIADSFRADG
jgi:hypothetical protein